MNKLLWIELPFNCPFDDLMMEWTHSGCDSSSFTRGLELEMNILADFKVNSSRYPFVAADILISRRRRHGWTFRTIIECLHNSWEGNPLKTYIFLLLIPYSTNTINNSLATPSLLQISIYSSRDYGWRKEKYSQEKFKLRSSRLYWIS